MYRFIKTAAFGLLWLGPHAIAGGKPAAPAISAGYEKICLLNLRWSPPTAFGNKPNRGERKAWEKIHGKRER